MKRANKTMMYRMYTYLCKEGDRAPLVALKDNDLNRFIKLIENKCYPNTKEAMELIAAKAIETTIASSFMVAFLNEKKFPLSKALRTAVAHGKFDLVKQIVELGNEPTFETLCIACKSGNLELCKWLVERGCDPDTVHTADVAAACQFEILKWLHSLGGKLRQNTVENAAYYNQTEMVKWCIEHGCEFKSELIFVYIGRNRNLALAQYMFDKYPQKTTENIPVMLKSLTNKGFGWSRENSNNHLQTFFFFLFNLSPDKQAFWNYKINPEFLDIIDLNSDDWSLDQYQSLYKVDLKAFPEFKKRVVWKKTIQEKSGINVDNV